MTQEFTKIHSHACSISNGKYLTWKEANLICSADPKCKFIQRDACLNSTIFPFFKLCGYESSFIDSNYSCVYKKEVIDRSGNINSNSIATSQGNDRIVDHASTFNRSYNSVRNAYIHLIHHNTSFIVKYQYPITNKWCKNNKDIEGIRDKCNSPNTCLEKARGTCDNDPNCFGFMWNQEFQFQRNYNFDRS